jgi:hypothetical protein
MVQDLMGWVVALTLAMILGTMPWIVFAAWSLLGTEYTILGSEENGWEVNAALQYVLDFDTQCDIRKIVRHTLTSYLHLLGLALSLIFILCIAKHAAWNKSKIADRMADMHPYAGVMPQLQYDHHTNANS